MNEAQKTQNRLVELAKGVVLDHIGLTPEYKASVEEYIKKAQDDPSTIHPLPQGVQPQVLNT